MVVKGMFGSRGKWALDDDSWKQLQIPAQKLSLDGEFRFKWRYIADFLEIFCFSMLMKIRKAELDDHKQAVVSVMCKESERLGRFC